jgi:FHA domain/von Willebrand factor type A domain
MRKIALAALTIFAFLALGAAAGPAHAADKLRIERLDLSAYPTMRLFVTYVDSDGRVITGRAKEDFHLILDSADQGVSQGAVSFDTYVPPAAPLPGHDPVSANIDVVIVVEVSGAMNEVFDDLKRGIKTLADSFDPKTKSKLALLGYASDTKRIAEMGAPAEVETAVNTMAVDSEGTEVHMLDAMRTAIDLLNAAPKNDRKLIVLFSDGIDVNMERRAFQAIGKKAQDADIVVDTIGYAPFEPGRLRNLQELSRQSQGTDRQCKNSGDIVAQFAAVSDEIKKNYVVTFTSPFADKKDHTVQCLVDAQGRQAYSNTLTKKFPDPIGHVGPPSRWWLWLLIAIGAIGILALIIFIVTRPKEEEPEAPAAPAPQPQAAAPAPAPAAGGPMKTMALDVSGGGKSPAIGWIVATNGKHANQTFKFKPSRTVIGTAADCDIVIDDQFMSSRHCEVRNEGGNYKLVDLGSTNGIVVNDKKVREHELVDNDQFRLGRTEFKFKSIS